MRRLSLLIAVVLVSTSCRSPDPAPATPEPTPALPERHAPPRVEALGNDTFIYRMQWQQADEAVETIRRLFEPRGLEIIMLPHEETNAILFRVVPARTEQ